MNYKSWRAWLRTKHWNLKWFVFLILLRPIIDNFYYLKEVSPLLSPLYWAGVLTPLLCIAPILKYTYFKNGIHNLFNLWSILIVINTFVLVVQPGDLISTSQWILKLSLPVYIFLFLRVFIKNKNDLLGLLTTFLYSAGIAAIMLIYELVFAPIRIEMSRGLERIQGGYADIMNYAIYLSFGFLILSYFYITYKLKQTNFRASAGLLFLVGTICLFGFIGISHSASYAVFASLLLLFLYSTAQRYASIAFVAVVVIVVLIVNFGSDFYEEKLNPLVEREVEVFEGDRDQSQLFHGRMARWEYAWDDFKDSPITAWVFGYPTSLENPYFQISIGIHNDYLRIFYFTGILGAILFYLFIYSLWRRKRFLAMPEKYLLYGSLAILLLYSVSTTPTFYANFLYILFTIFVYLSLPAQQLKRNE